MKFEEAMNLLDEAQLTLDGSNLHPEHLNFQLTFDDLDENGDIKPEVLKAMEKRVELNKDYIDRCKEVDNLGADYTELHKATSAAKRAWNSAKTAEDVDRLGKKYLDALTKEMAAEFAYKKYYISDRQLSDDELNNKEIETEKQLYNCNRTSGSGKLNLYPNAEWEKEIEDERNRRKEENDAKFNGQTWFDIDDKGNMKQMYRKKLSGSEDNNLPHGTSASYDIHHSTYFIDTPVEDEVDNALELDFPELDEYGDIIDDLRSGKITREEASKKIKEIKK